MLSNHDLDNPKIKHFRHGIEDFDSENMDMFEISLHPEKMYEQFEAMFVNISRKMFEEPVVKILYANRKNFDLIVMNHMFNNVSHMVAKLYWQNLSLSNLLKFCKSVI